MQLDTGEQNRTDIGMWSHRVCTWHARVRQASVAQYASAASDRGRTSVYHWLHELPSSTLVATCWWWSLKPQQRQCYIVPNSNEVTLAGMLNTIWVKYIKILCCDQFLALCWKWYKKGTLLLWNTNRWLYVIYLCHCWQRRHCSQSWNLET